jgi:chromate reductase, NAD(P)H dehydrogenase (quinone)
MKEIPFRGLPIYSYDYDADFPPVAKDFMAAIASADAILFVTPEYNPFDSRRIEKCDRLGKPTLRPELVSRKACAVIGTSPGSIHRHGNRTAAVRACRVFCNAPKMNAPEAYIQFKPGLIGDDGKLTEPTTEEFLRTYMSDFHAFIVPVYTVLPRNP